MSRAKDFLKKFDEGKEMKEPSKKEMKDEASPKKTSSRKPMPAVEPVKQPINMAGGAEQKLSDEQIQQELSALFAQKSPNFEKVYEKIIKIVERRPMTQRAEIYKNLLNMLLKSIVGPSMINRQLFNGARDFWRNLVSGVYYK